MFDKLLVAVDGSDHSNRAVALAADLAGHYGSDVVLLHVAHSPSRTAIRGVETYEGLEHFEIEERDVLTAEARWVTDEAEAKLRSAGIENVEKVIVFGHPAAEIIRYAKDDLSPGDAIVMGRRGLGDFTGLLLGSVSHRVGHLSDFTVITAE
jgi:nucleotide-binding universal stress UspA family protein